MQNLTFAQMRAIERSAIESGQVTGAQLMERAGEGVVAAIFAQWPDMRDVPHRAVILCGPGNNGGDGFVVARRLAARGWQVMVFFYGVTERLPPDARQMHDLWAALGPVRALSFPHPTRAEVMQFREHADEGTGPPFLLVDALFGIGLSRPLVALEEIILHVDDLRALPERNPCRIVAIDVPSGLDADTGLYVMDPDKPGLGGVSSDLTVTFHACKTGHLTGIGPRVCGVVRVVDIGLGPCDGVRHHV